MSRSLAAKLGSKLDRELAWRKKELITIYFDVPDDDSTPLAKAKCRQAIVILYSHWEGFAKNAFKLYLTEIASARPNPRTLRAELLGLCFRKQIKAAAARRVAHDIGKCMKAVTDPLANLPRVPKNGVVQTRSNLSGAVLREILENLGLNPSQYSTYEADPIHVLLNSRNKVAHGDGIPIPVESYKRIHRSMLNLMDELRSYLEDELAASSYLG